MIETWNIANKTPSAAQLKTFPLFAPFSSAQLERALTDCSVFSYGDNQIFLRQGESAQTLFFLLRGGVKIELKDSAGITYPLGELGAGSLCGELALLRGELSRVTLKTSGSADLLQLSRAAFLNLISSASAEQTLDVFLTLQRQNDKASERGFREALALRSLDSQMEVEKQRALTQLVAGLAHEIKTPLNIINTAVTIMARELVSAPAELTAQRAAEIAESLEVMRRNVERADALIQDFKTLSISQLSDERAAFDMVRVVEESIGLISVNLKRSQIKARFHHALPDHQREWVGYRGLLSQVLINLLANLERYAYPNGAGGAVDVTLKLDARGNFILSVCDYGNGISPQDQPRIFEPFFTTGKTIGGTGLGLSIVKNVVCNLLHGDIQVASTLGAGSEFIVTLPRIVPE